MGYLLIKAPRVVRAWFSGCAYEREQGPCQRGKLLIKRELDGNAGGRAGHGIPDATGVKRCMRRSPWGVQQARARALTAARAPSATLGRVASVRCPLGLGHIPPNYVVEPRPLRDPLAIMQSYLRPRSRRRPL